MSGAEKKLFTNTSAYHVLLKFNIGAHLLKRSYLRSYLLFFKEGGGTCAWDLNVVRREGTSVNNGFFFFFFRRGISTLLKE